MSKIRVSKIKISNILGIDELEFEPGGFTEVSGRNGQGKTSVLEAMRSVVRGGHDGTLLRNGADEGEVVLILDNGMTITERVTPKKTDRAVERDGMQSKSPSATIKALADLLSVNPIDFLRASKKDRVNVLLEAMPMPVDLAKLAEVSGTDTAWLEGHGHALDAIADLNKQIYDERTGVNRAAKEKAATVKQLTDTLPEETESVDADGLAALRDQLREMEARRDQELQRVETKLGDLRQQHEEKMEELRRQMDVEREAFAEMERRAGQQKQKTVEAFHRDRAGVTEQITAAEAVQGQLARAEQTRETIAAMQSDVDALTSDSEAKTAAISALDAYKAELLSSLPIPGVEVRDGEIFRAGVPFDRLNTASQVQIAVEVAKLRAGKLGLVCVDGIELLDTGAYEEFKKQALESDLQMVVARVSDDDFSVTTNQAAPTAAE